MISFADPEIGGFQHQPGEEGGSGDFGPGGESFLGGGWVVDFFSFGARLMLSTPRLSIMLLDGGGRESRAVDE